MWSRKIGSVSENSKAVAAGARNSQQPCRFVTGERNYKLRLCALSSGETDLIQPAISVVADIGAWVLFPLGPKTTIRPSDLREALA
jgi:hypothetical protein